MAGQAWCTGPVHLFVSLPNNIQTTLPAGYQVVPSQIAGPRVGRPGIPLPRPTGPAPVVPIEFIIETAPPSSPAPPPPTQPAGGNGGITTSLFPINPLTLNASPTVVPVSTLPAIRGDQYLPYFLGTSKYGFTIYVRKSMRPMRTSASPDIPDDLMQTGEEAMVTGTLNLYDETIYAAIGQASPGHQFPRGTQALTDSGQLMIRGQAGGNVHTVYLYFPYATKPQMGGTIGRVIPPPTTWPPNNTTLGLGGLGSGPFAPNGQTAQMPEGYRFLNCTLVAPETYDPLGSRAREIHLTWHAIKDYPEVDNDGFYDESYAMRLYDTDMTDLRSLGQPIQDVVA
jgi:hypothetical protein